MMAFRWTGSHAYRDHANDRVIEPGDELPEDIAERVASAHPHDVEEIEEDGCTTDHDALEDGESCPECEFVAPLPEAEEAAGDGDDAPDVDEWADWNEEDWLDVGYQQRVEDVQEGRVDEHLEEIAEIETSSTVEEAVDARLDELSE